MNTNNIIRYSIFAGLWAVLIIPFYVAGSMFFPYISGKNFAFRIIVEIIFALWVYLAFIDAKYRPKFSWVLGAVGLYTLVMFVADIFSIAPMKAFWSNFERMDGWVTTIHLLMYLIVFGSVMKTEKAWLWFFRTSLISSMIMLVSVLREWLTTGAERVSVSLGNPIYVAVYFMFNFFFALILLYKDVVAKKMETKKPFIGICKNWLFYIYSLLALLCVFGIWRTSTRGVILGLIGGVAVAALLAAIFEKKNKYIKDIAIGGIVMIMILIGGFFSIKDTDFAKNNTTLSRLSSISWSNVSGQGQARQYVWPMALKGFQERPILGWGNDGFNYVFNKYYDERMYSQEQWFDRAHDMPLDVLVAGGVLGFISYLGIFVAALWLIWKRRNRLGIADGALLVGILAGYFFQNLFVFDNLTSYVYFFVILAYLHSIDTDDKESFVAKKEGGMVGISKDLAYYVVAPVLVITFFASLWFVNIKPISANLNLIKAMSGYPEGPIKNLEYFNKALSLNTFANPEILEQMLNITPSVLKMDGVSQEVKQSFLKLTYDQAQKQLKNTPNDARYQFFFGVFLNNLGAYADALPYLEKSVDLSPKKITMMFELTKCLSFLDQNDKAIEVAKRAYDLMPSYEEGKINYAAALIVAGNEKMAKEILLGLNVTSERIVRAYLLRATLFLQKNDKASAVLEVKKASAMVPGFEKQANEVIDGIWKGTIK